MINPFGNAEFAPGDPIVFDYGVRAGFSTYVGAEIYLEVSFKGLGTIIVK